MIDRISGYLNIFPSNDNNGSRNTESQINRSIGLLTSTTAQARHRPESNSLRTDGSEDTTHVTCVTPEGDVLYWNTSSTTSTNLPTHTTLVPMWSQPTGVWPQLTSSWVNVPGRMQGDSDSMEVARLATNTLHFPSPHNDPRAAEGNAPHSIVTQTRRRDTAGYGTPFHTVDSTTANPWRHSKSIIKVSPTPLEQLPATAPPPFWNFAADPVLQEASASHSLLSSTSNGGGRFTGQGCGDIPRPLGGDIPTHEQDRARSTISSPQHKGVGGDDSLCSYHCHGSSSNHSACSPNNRTPSLLRLGQSTRSNPHTTEQPPYHNLGPLNDGRSREDVGLIFQPEALEPGRDPNPRRLVAIMTTNPLHSPKEVHTPAVAGTPLDSTGATSSTRQDGSSRSGSPPEHTDAVDAFLGVTQTTSTSRHLDDALERGMIGTQLEVESELSPWLDINIFGRRTKVLITVLALGTVLLGAIAKLSQEIRSQSSTH